MATTFGSIPHVAHRRDDARDLIAALRDRAEAIRHEELRRLGGWWDGLCPGDRVRLEMLTRSIVEALLHEPTARLRAEADVETARFLFALEDAEPGHPGTPGDGMSQTTPRRGPAGAP